MKKEIVELGINENKIEVIPFGIDPQIFNTNNRIVPKDKFVIISTRNFEQVYNIPMLLKAIAHLKETIPHLMLHLVGSGSLESSIKMLIKELNIEHIVNYCGKISQLQISDLLNKSHVYISASNSDGNNISLNEAMACGTCCIATDIPANSQWITEGVNGHLVPCNDYISLSEKILFCYNNYDTIAPTYEVINQQIIAKKAIWKNNMQTVIEQYKRLLNNVES